MGRGLRLRGGTLARGRITGRVLGDGVAGEGQGLQQPGWGSGGGGVGGYIHISLCMHGVLCAGLT